MHDFDLVIPLEGPNTFGMYPTPFASFTVYNMQEDLIGRYSSTLSLGGEPIARNPAMTVHEYFQSHPLLSQNPYYPFHRTEFYLAQMWLHNGIPQGVMDQLIRGFREIKPAGAPKTANDFLHQDEIRIRSVQDIKKMISFMPETNDGDEWVKIRLNLPEQWAALDKLPEADGLYVYIRKNIWEVISSLFGNPQFAGLIHTKFSEEFDTSTTYRDENRNHVNPRVYSEMWTAEWWREMQV
jgi:hypothetical protein